MCLLAVRARSLEYLAVKASGQPFTARALATFRNNSWRDIRRARNQFWSSFRYATTHDDDQDGYSRLVSGFSDLQNDHALLVGWYDLMLACKKLPIEAQMFQSWYFALYPEKLGSEADVSRYETLFPRLRDLARSDQKNALRDANRTFPTRPVNAEAKMHRLAGAKIHQRCWQVGPRTGGLFVRGQAWVGLSAGASELARCERRLL